jgi:hypothetical protein
LAFAVDLRFEHEKATPSNWRHAMRAIAAAVVLAFGLAVVAGAAQEQQQSQQKPAGEHSMTGCLQKGASANTFRLTNVEKVNNVDIAESKADLAAHLGHKIEITGTVVPGKETHTMNVTAMKMVSTTCP